MNETDRDHTPAEAPNASSIKRTPANKGSDGELLAAHRYMQEAERALDAMRGDLSPGCDERMERPLMASYVALDRMMALPAMTPEGLAAKADALRWILERTVCVSTGGDGVTSVETLDRDGEWQDQAAWSLARDVLAFAERIRRAEEARS